MNLYENIKVRTAIYPHNMNSMPKIKILDYIFDRNKCENIIIHRNLNGRCAIILFNHSNKQWIAIEIEIEQFFYYRSHENPYLVMNTHLNNIENGNSYVCKVEKLLRSCLLITKIISEITPLLVEF